MMAKGTTGPKSQLVSKLAKIKASDVSALARLSAADTTSTDFGRIFKENPMAALATKGIMISDVEASRLNAEIGRLAGGPGGNVAATEVEVSVKVKF
jgi:hypothetical protein